LSSPPRQPAPPRPRARSERLAIEQLEGREVPAAGGGFTAGGLQGEYFDNPDLSGDPAYTRRDVRIDFDWGERAPGGSTSPDYQRVGADGFSVRWTGQLVPKFSEQYTFTATGDDGVRLWLRPADGPWDWTQLVDRWDDPAGGVGTGEVWLAAGHPYDVRLEYREIDGPALASLIWVSPSTPPEVIEPAVNLGVNAVTYDHYLYADAAKAGWAEWGDPVDYFGNPRVATDADGWPLSDAGHLFWESRDPTKTGGVYLLQFTGQAEVSGWMGRGRFRAGGAEYGMVLPAGAGYDPVTNTTTADVTIEGTDIFGLNFVKTQRTPDDPEGTGVTNVRLMRPLTPDADSSYQPGELFDASVKNALSRFTTLRYLTANFNPEKEWADRKLPGTMTTAWGDRAAVWEYEVMLANETGKDLYITLPVMATADYIRNLANLIRYGSDGVNPYTEPVDDPVYPGLNPNLRVYVEWGSEIWNWAFSQGGWAADAGRAAVLEGTPDGQIVNFDGKRENGDFRRWAALKTVQASKLFREVWGDAAMGDRVRVVLEYQYDNVQGTAVEALRFIDQYFNNGDGRENVPDPHPVSYYIWGAGGASYFGASNPRGLVDDIRVPGGTFDTARVGPGGTATRTPGNTPWVFSGDAGIYRDRAGIAPNAVMNVPAVGAVPATPQGAQALFVSGTGTASVTIDFPRAGVFAIDFRAAAEPGLGNLLDFYLDDQRVTPNGGAATPPPYPWWPGNGNRNANAFSAYGTVPVAISAPGRHTFKIVGRGSPDQTTVIDDVRVASTDALFASRIPAGGQAAGQVSRMDYQAQLIAQARYALAYGLKVVAYEGGWSLGGDREGVPLQGWAKYNDPRTAAAMSAAIDAFFRAGGELNILGTYDQWHADDAVHDDAYPIVQGIDVRLATLPADATAGIRVPGMAPLRLAVVSGLRAYTLGAMAGPGDWVSWTIIVPSSGQYRITASTGRGGTAAIYADGAPIASGTSGRPVAGPVLLSAGTHTIRVQCTGGRFSILNALVERLDALLPVTEGPPGP
jgi:hypothetical protein